MNKMPLLLFISCFVCSPGFADKDDVARLVNSFCDKEDIHVLDTLLRRASRLDASKRSEVMNPLYKKFQIKSGSGSRWDFFEEKRKMVRDLSKLMKNFKEKLQQEEREKINQEIQSLICPVVSGKNSTKRNTKPAKEQFLERCFETIRRIDDLEDLQTLGEAQKAIYKLSRKEKAFFTQWSASPREHVKKWETFLNSENDRQESKDQLRAILQAWSERPKLKILQENKGKKKVCITKAYMSDLLSFKKDIEEDEDFTYKCNSYKLIYEVIIMASSTWSHSFGMFAGQKAVESLPDPEEIRNYFKSSLNKVSFPKNLDYDDFFSKSLSYKMYHYRHKQKIGDGISFHIGSHSDGLLDLLKHVGTVYPMALKAKDKAEPLRNNFVRDLLKITYKRDIVTKIDGSLLSDKMKEKIINDRRYAHVVIEEEGAAKVKKSISPKKK